MTMSTGTQEARQRTLIPNEHFRQMASFKTKPPNATAVWVGNDADFFGRTNPQPIARFHVKPYFFPQPEFPEIPRGQLYIATLGIGCLVMRVLGHNVPAVTLNIGQDHDYEGALYRIAPNGPPSWQWPPSKPISSSGGWDGLVAGDPAMEKL
jgi:hypothetical protein